MARRYWHCDGCSTRNERIGGRKKCAKCGRAAPKTRRPTHAWALEDVSYDRYVELQQEIHGVDEQTCALCLTPRRGDHRLDRDHAHFDGGYPRGLVHSLCNKRMGEIERGQDGEQWARAYLAYVDRVKRWRDAA